MNHRSVVITYYDDYRTPEPPIASGQLSVDLKAQTSIHLCFGPETAEWIATPTPTLDLAQSYDLRINAFDNATHSATATLRLIGPPGTEIWSMPLSYSGEYDPTLSNCSVNILHTALPYESQLSIQYKGTQFLIPAGI